MTAHSVPLRRRSATERRVLAMLRGEDHLTIKASGRSASPTKATPLSKSQGLFFAELRRVAARDGIAVQQPGSPYVGNGELVLMSWIAEAQRIAGHSGTMPVDPPFVAAIARCAGLLDALGLHLSPMTLYGARLRASGPAPHKNMSIVHFEAD